MASQHINGDGLAVDACSICAASTHYMLPTQGSQLIARKGNNAAERSEYRIHGVYALDECIHWPPCRNKSKQACLQWAPYNIPLPHTDDSMSCSCELHNYLGIVAPWLLHCSRMLQELDVVLRSLQEYLLLYFTLPFKLTRVSHANTAL